MIIGIDVGGTHTDGVLVSRSGKKFQIKKTAKIPTEHHNLKNSILKLLDNLTKNIDSQKLERVVLSTTLVTNIIYENDYQAVGLILIPGPGINPKYLKYGEENSILTGSIDHRGKVVKDIDEEEVKASLQKMQAEGIKNLAIVSKFSVRNPSLEEKVKEIALTDDYDFETISLGHSLSGKLNFHRRVITSYFNTAVSAVHNDFIDSIKESFKTRNIKAELYLLKCDGGTTAIEASRKIPIETINSGPAASIMGTMLLNKSKESGVVLDIGGTTTDFGLFIKGEPVFKPRGINIAGHASLIRGLYSYSIALGGDSELHHENGELKIGPRRRGPAAALGGPAPTPTDALLLLAKIKKDDIKKEGFDIEKAKNSLLKLKEKIEISKYPAYFKEKEEISLKEFANFIINQIAQKIENTLNKMLKTIENQPVYTISELLESSEINLSYLLGIGGPAEALTEVLAEKLKLKAVLTDHSKVVNAVGAAFSQPTVETTVRADTARGFLDIPELGIHRSLKNKDFNLSDAKKLAEKWTLKRASQHNYQVEVISEESFNIIRRQRRLGKIIELKTQIKPGLIAFLNEENNLVEVDYNEES